MSGQREDLGQRRHDLVIAFRYAGELGGGELGNRHPYAVLISQLRVVMNYQLSVAAQVDVDLNIVEPMRDGDADREQRILRRQGACPPMTHRLHRPAASSREGARHRHQRRQNGGGDKHGDDGQQDA